MNFIFSDIIDDLGEHIDQTDVRISNETRNVGLIDRKDKTCVYWVIIVLLFISIMVVAFIWIYYLLLWINIFDMLKYYVVIIIHILLIFYIYMRILIFGKIVEMFINKMYEMRSVFLYVWHIDNYLCWTVSEVVNSRILDAKVNTTLTK